jgi:hypothetical protein
MSDYTNTQCFDSFNLGQNSKLYGALPDYVGESRQEMT